MKVKRSLAHRLLFRTQFGLHESVSDSQVVSGDGLSVHHPQQSELGRQGVHDQGQVSLPNLRTQTKRRYQVWVPAEI